MTQSFKIRNTGSFVVVTSVGHLLMKSMLFLIFAVNNAFTSHVAFLLFILGLFDVHSSFSCMHFRACSCVSGI